VFSFSWAARCSLAMPPSPGHTKGYVGLSGSDLVGVVEGVYVSPPPQWGHPPELKVEQGRQQSLAPAQGLNQRHPAQVLLLSSLFYVIL